MTGSTLPSPVPLSCFIHPGTNLALQVIPEGEARPAPDRKSGFPCRVIWRYEDLARVPEKRACAEGPG